MLHITDGESVAGTLRSAALLGDVSIYGDLLCEGPTPGDVDSETWREMRASFLAGPRGLPANLEESRQYLKACDDTLAAISRHDEVVLWFDHRLSDQLILIKVLDWFRRQNLGGVKLSLISVAQYPGVDHFVGLGQLNSEQLASLAGTRVLVGESQLRKAQEAWNAFTSPDPTAIERLLQTDTSPLPFLAAALRRHLEQFPSLENGLSRTERQALCVLRDQGPRSRPRLFVAVQRQEEQIFMGDTSFYRIMADLSNAPHPLVHEVSGELTITETGRTVLEGRADHVNLNGIDRWLGGVHLVGPKADWRWDRTAARLVPLNSE